MREKLQGFAGLNFNHKKIDWALVNRELHMINWYELLKNKTEDEVLTLIYEKILTVSQKFIPRKGESIRKSIIPRERRILMRNRANINKQLRKTSSLRKVTLERKLAKIEYKILDSHRKQEKARELRAVNTIKENSKYFFAYAKKKSSIQA